MHQKRAAWLMLAGSSRTTAGFKGVGALQGGIKAVEKEGTRREERKASREGEKRGIVPRLIVLELPRASGTHF